MESCPMRDTVEPNAKEIQKINCAKCRNQKQVLANLNVKRFTFHSESIWTFVPELDDESPRRRKGAHHS